VFQANQVEELITVVSVLDKPALVKQIQQYPARFPVDFTAEFLDNQPLDCLRHLFVARCVQSQRFPEIPAGEA
jgi:hypothetical protein